MPTTVSTKTLRLARGLRNSNLLLPVLWKVDRAETLMAHLKEGASALASTSRWQGLQVDEPRSTVHRRYLIGRAFPAPFRFDSVAADFVHNLRAALDQLAWRLAGSPQPPALDTYFPVTQRRPHAQLKGTARMKASAAAKMEQLQPYHGRAGGDLLWLLHSLWNQDKHRTTPLISIVEWSCVVQRYSGNGSLPAHGSGYSTPEPGLVYEPISPVSYSFALSRQSQLEPHYGLFEFASNAMKLIRDRIIPMFGDADFQGP